MTNFQSKPKHEVNPHSQAHILIEIEQLVEKIIAHNNSNASAAKTETFKAQVFGITCLNRQRYFSVFSPNYKYSEHIEAFWYGCKAIGLLIPLTDFGSGCCNLFLLPPNSINLLVESVLHYVKSNKFRRCAGDRLQQTEENKASIRSYADALQKKYSRLLVIRVDLKYETKAQHLIGIDDLYKHLEALNSKKAYHDVFQHEVGSAWAIEQGVTLGYHIHFAFYFKGSEHQNDWIKAQKIEALWHEVTKGMGKVYICNNRKDKAKFVQQGKLGIGMIHRIDPVACQNSVDAVSYLADPKKLNQYLRIKPIGRKTFSTGILKVKTLKPKC